MKTLLLTQHSRQFSRRMMFGFGMFFCAALVLSEPLHADNTSASTDSNAFSPANTALFATNHMQAVKPEQTLVYTVQQTGSMVPSIQDTITLKLTRPQTGHTEAQIEFMTGENYRWTPPFTDPKGNPVLTLFLQSDIHEMERINGGQWRHFQKYIKFALEKANFDTTDFEYAGRHYQGKKISIRPYLDDPDKSKFINQAFINKHYEFIVADELPGGIYKITTDVPGTDAGQPVAHKELLLRAP